jgi:ferredoxin-nitrite reductase
MLSLKEAKNLRSGKINKIEKIKKLKEPLSVYNALKAISNGSWEDLNKEDIDFFLKCFGIFKKEKDFMIRIRISGGKLKANQAKVIGEIAQKYGNDYIDFTTRMQIELRYIKLKDLYNIIKELEKVGLTTFQTGIDNIRNILTDPLDGISHDNIIYAQDLIDKMQDVFLKQSKFIGTLPRKFNVAVLGSLSNSCNVYGHDLSFVLANKDGIWGFNIYLGGKVGKQAVDAKRFVKKEQVVKVFSAVIKVFKKYGYTDNRNKNRLYFLLQDTSIETFLCEVEKELGFKLESSGINMVTNKIISGFNKVLTKDNKFAYKLVIAGGIFSGSDLISASNAAQTYGNGELRISYEQNLWILGVNREFEKSEIYQKYSKFNNIYFNNLIACAGTKTCSFGVIENKSDAIKLSNFLNEELKNFEGQIRFNWSACVKGCGVHGIADIGFEGCKVKTKDKKTILGVHIFVGGKITKEGKEAYILHKNVPLTQAKEHIKFLVLIYKELKMQNESFEEFEYRFLSKFSKGAVAFFTKINLLLQDRGYKFMLEYNLISGKIEEIEIFKFGLKLYKIITGENRFDGVDLIEPIKVKPKTITEDFLAKAYGIPLNISRAIYLMTHENRKKRAKVFTEILKIIEG